MDVLQGTKKSVGERDAAHNLHLHRSTLAEDMCSLVLTETEQSFSSLFVLKNLSVNSRLRCCSLWDWSLQNFLHLCVDLPCSFKRLFFIFLKSFLDFSLRASVLGLHGFAADSSRARRKRRLCLLLHI